MAKIIHVYTMCWGRPFVDWWSRFALPSMMQPGNIGALKAAGYDVRWTVFTMQEDTAAIIEAGAFHSADLRVECFEINGVPTLRKVQSMLLITAAERALKDDAIFVPASSVTIWGDGSLYNVVKTAEVTDCATGAIYLLARGEDWGAAFDDGRTYKGDELAALCFETLHPGSRSTLDAADSRAWLYGLGLLQLSPTLFAARIQVPSIAAVRFKPSDIALFRLEDDFRCWDGPHWVGGLIAQGRYTFLASSDLAMQVNLMRAGKMNLANHEALQAGLSGMVDRRHALRATVQAEQARGFMCSIRTSRAVKL